MNCTTTATEIPRKHLRDLASSQGSITDDMLLALYEGLSPEGKELMYRLALEAVEREAEGAA